LLVPDEFQVESVGGMLVVTAPAEIDFVNCEHLQAVLTSASRRASIVVVDMSQTTSCDASAIGVLVRAARRTAADGGELRLVATPGVRRMLSVIGVDEILLIFNYLADAVAAERAS